jgi:hypothetical protein
LAHPSFSTPFSIPSSPAWGLHTCTMLLCTQMLRTETLMQRPDNRKAGRWLGV